MCTRSNGSSTRSTFAPWSAGWISPSGGVTRRLREVVADGNGVTQVDVYVETDDWRFQRAGYALRIRSLGRRRGAEATLKALDPASAGAPGSRGRREVSERLEARRHADTPSAPTAPWAARVRAVRERSRCCRCSRCAPAAAPSSSRPRACHRGDRARRDHDPAAWRRIPGAAAASRDRGARRPRLQAFEPFVRELRDACALQPAGLSKFEAGLLSSDLRSFGRPSDSA